MKRRTLLRWPAALLAGSNLGGLAGCAQLAANHDRLIDLRSGRDIRLDTLLEQARSCAFLLLGELHDNPHHHARRAALLRRLGPDGAVVVAEHLTRGKRTAVEGDLLPALKDAGFDPAGWQWPLHQPLFAAARESGLALLGGNLPGNLARRIAREGEAALPSELAAVLAAAPLDPASQASLDDDLRSGHCHQLPAARLPAMRLAQRARDASMWLALRDGGGQPAVLLAGNGHIRRDWGVGQLARVLAPQTGCISVAFGEFGANDREDIQDATTFATHLWLTPAVDREDPCRSLPIKRLPATPPRSESR